MQNDNKRVSTVGLMSDTQSSTGGKIGSGMQGAMDGMMQGLNGKNGDEFEEAF